MRTLPRRVHPRRLSALAAVTLLTACEGGAYCPSPPDLRRAGARDFSVAPDPSRALVQPAWVTALTTQTGLRIVDVAALPADPMTGPTGSVVLGLFDGPLRAPDGTDLETEQLNESFFLARLDPSGQVSWVKRQIRSAYGITGFWPADDLRLRAAPDGRLLVSGSFQGAFELTFGPNDTRPRRSRDSYDPFLAVYGPDGSLKAWDDRGGQLDDRSHDAAFIPGAPGGADMVLVGELRYRLNLPQGQFPEGDYLTSRGGCDALVLVFDAAARVLRYSTFGKEGDERLDGVAADATGNLYLSGSYDHGLQLPGGLELRGPWERNAFIARQGPDGVVAWAVFASGPATERGGRVALDGQGNVYWMARVGRGARIRDARIPEARSSDPGFLDGGDVVTKLTADGAILWSRRVAPATDGPVARLAVAPDGGFVVVSDGFLGSFDASGVERWRREGGDAIDLRGADIVGDGVLVGGYVAGTRGLDPIDVVTPGDFILRGNVARFPLAP